MGARPVRWSGRTQRRSARWRGSRVEVSSDAEQVARRDVEVFSETADQLPGPAFSRRFEALRTPSECRKGFDHQRYVRERPFVDARFTVARTEFVHHTGQWLRIR